MRRSILAFALVACGGHATQESPSRLPEPTASATPAQDPKQAALVRALGGCGGNQLGDETRSALEELAAPGAKPDPIVTNALWNCFVAFSPSRSKSLRGTVALHDAILGVKSPSWAERALALLSGHARREDGDVYLDEIQFRETTAVQLLRALAYGPAVRPLVVTLLDRDKLDMSGVVRAALVRMSRQSVPVLASALLGNDPALRHDASSDTLLVAVLCHIGTDAARSAVISALPQLHDDARAAAAQSFVYFPKSTDRVAMFRRIYDGLPPGIAKAQILGVARWLFDPSMVPWLLDEMARATGDARDAAEPAALQSAIHLMQASDKKRVEKAVNASSPAVRTPLVDLFGDASKAVDTCGTRLDCWIAQLDDPLAARATKAATMVGVLGNDEARKALVARLDRAAPALRVALSMAILELAPSGDDAAATALEAVHDESTLQAAAILRARARM